MLIFANNFKHCFKIEEETKNFCNRFEFNLFAKEIQEQSKFYRNI